MTKKMKKVMGSVATGNDSAEAEINAVKVTPTMITGYQYGDHGNFIGEYRFEKNLDKEEVHCPPCTTLIAPPDNLPIDQEAYFDGKQWQARRLTLPWMPLRVLPEIGEEQSGH